MAPLTSSNRSASDIGLSIAVPQTSPSPCAAWVSPTENRPPVDLDRQIELGAGGEVADVHVAAARGAAERCECRPGSAGARPIVPQNGLSGTRPPGPYMAGARLAGSYFQIAAPAP